MFRVFLGAPSAADIDNDAAHYQWQTSSSFSALSSSSSPPSVPVPAGHLAATQKDHDASESPTSDLSDSLVVPFPIATLEAASQRISLVYKNIIFSDKQDEESIESIFRESGDQTTLYTWPSTSIAQSRQDEGDDDDSDDSSKSQSQVIDMVLETQEDDDQVPHNEETQLLNYTTDRHSYSYSYANTTSINDSATSLSSVLPPKFNFTLNSIQSLSTLAKSRPPSGSGSGPDSWSLKVNLLMATLEVDGPNTIRIKRGVDIGKEVSVLSLVLGDEHGSICKLTAWREVAETWGGAVQEVVGVKRGDVVFIANVLATWNNTNTSTTTSPPPPPTLTASPYLKSRMEICYRTMPYTHEDRRLRPDLRLESDDRARRVAAVVRWFEGIAGL